VLAGALFATEGFLFKYGTTDHSFWTGAFYQYAGLALTGLVVAVASRKFRENFWLVFRANKKIILTVSLLNQALAIGAFMLYNYAVLLAPLALVALVSNTQPFFVIAFGILLTVFFPKLGQKLTLLDGKIHFTPNKYIVPVQQAYPALAARLEAVRNAPQQIRERAETEVKSEWYPRQDSNL
jgi:hypothetical protein